jgi:hypothetical protein
VNLIAEYNPPDDFDGDEIQNLGDNCPFIANYWQKNRGAFLDYTDHSDSLGDACQCGESTTTADFLGTDAPPNDGAISDPDDLDLIRDYLSGEITNSAIRDRIEARCSVVGDGVRHRRPRLLQRAVASRSSVATRCDAALSPPQSGP